MKQFAATAIRLFVPLLLILGSACGTMRAYQGSELPKDETAVLKARYIQGIMRSLTLMEFDEDRVRGATSSFITAAWRICFCTFSHDPS